MADHDSRMILDDPKISFKVNCEKITFFVYHVMTCSQTTTQGTDSGYLQIMSNGCHMNVTCYIFALDKERDLLLFHFITLMSR